MSRVDQVDPPWWQEAVFYQVYPLSFGLADSAGRSERLGPRHVRGGTETTGTKASRNRRAAEQAGDLEGIRQRLEYLSWLGVDALWLSPTQPSPMADFGYDVADYRDIDPLFGTLEDFDHLLADVHAAGMRLIVDLVPNHTSDRHPWFEEARHGLNSPKRDWYYWRPGTPDAPPNNWRETFHDAPAWTWDPATSEWYLHLFLAEQPDLNWGNEAVRDEMEAVMGWWLDRGVDGFRIDVVHALGKDPALPDAPPALAHIPWSGLNDYTSTHAILRRLRALWDARESEPVIVGEVFLLDTAKVATYYGAGDELHLGFNFPPMFCDFDAICFRDRIEEVEALLPAGGARWPTWVLSSHDRSRARTRYGGSEARARCAAVLLLTLRGTPFLFAGEEIGLEDAAPVAEPLDPGGRDGCRAPIPWDGSHDHGWDLDGLEPWLPWPPNAATRNVAAQRADRDSILHLYRRLLTERRSSAALRRGTLELLESPPETLAFLRRAGDDERLVVVNFGGSEQRVRQAEGRPVLVSTAYSSSSPRSSSASPTSDGAVGPESALVLGPI